MVKVKIQEGEENFSITSKLELIGLIMGKGLEVCRLRYMVPHIPLWYMVYTI